MALKIVAAYLLAAAKGEKPTKEDVETILKSLDCEYDTAILDKLLAELDGKSLAEIVAEGRSKLKASGGGGGGGGGGGAAAGGGAGGDAGAGGEAAPPPEEEEDDMEFDLFD